VFPEKKKKKFGFYLAVLLLEQFPFIFSSKERVTAVFSFVYIEPIDFSFGTISDKKNCKLM
jgi:hypothetical protein